MRFHTRDGGSANTVKTDDESIIKYIVDSKNVKLDLDTAPVNNRGWFRFIASDGSDEKDGFIMYITYRGDYINGMAQYWDETNISS